MQSVSSWIWTRVAVSISYDDKHYTTGAPIIINVNFNFFTANVSGCFRGVMTQFEIVKPKFSNQMKMHIHLWVF